MNDYFRCAKTNGFSKSNIKLLTVVTEVTIWFKWSEPRDVVVVKIASWVATEARIMAGVAKLRSASRPPTNLIQSAKRLAHLFRHHVSDCGQQCSTGLAAACLLLTSHCIQPSSDQVVANSALGSKRLATPGLWRQSCRLASWFLSYSLINRKLQKFWKGAKWNNFRESFGIIFVKSLTNNFRENLTLLHNFPVLKN